ncbi:hypothetical protein [Comamonas flocculans]|uniref:DUF1190 domain-containing protein n=1 Tax=Comamonas flocculans TaxID=2597701 RepID=A0A5B8RWM6_9BURK|nr:hypothetical protein [Comamonas flocculans]QEA13114.1 hypothetical protein FOZ74_08755 [Comamonas flocculans]
MRNFRLSVFVGSALLVWGAQAQAAGPSAAQQCADSTQVSHAACVREVGAAAQAARRGQLTSEDAATYERNAMARCSVFKNAQDRADCEKRMGPSARLSGSVDGGGLLREETTTYTITK